MRIASLARLFVLFICVCVPLARADEPIPETKERLPVVITTTVDGKKFETAKIYGDFDRGPIPMSQSMAMYPEALRAQGVSGIAIVSFVLDEKGRMGDIQVKASHPDFAKEALKAARLTHFTPAKKNGKGVACRMASIFEFPGPWVRGPPK